MGRFSPTVLPDDTPPAGLSMFLDELSRGPDRARQAKYDRRAQEEHDYTMGRHEKTDPMEDALRLAQLYEAGVVPDDGSGSPTAGAIDAHRAPMHGVGGLAGRSPNNGRGIHAPGAFNPTSGTFNDPMAPTDMYNRGTGSADVTDIYRGNVPLGGGYHIDRSLTPEGRRESVLAHQIDVAGRAGIPREEAELELRSHEGISSEHFHPSEWHPHTRNEADQLASQQHKYRLEEIKAGVDWHDRNGKDPRWDERRRGWIKTLGGQEPTNQLQQDLIDALADGDEPNALLEKVPPSSRAEAERYLRRALRVRGRETRPPLGAEVNK